MKKTLLLIIAFIGLLALYKTQHVKPVEDPRESPIFQQRLQSSLDKFQEGDYPAGAERRMQDKSAKPGAVPSSGTLRQASQALIAAGRCGRLTLTWAETGMIDKSSVQIKRKSGDQEFALSKQRNIYHREEEAGGIRYWAADDGLTDGETYHYLVSFKDEQGKEAVRGPVAISLTCTGKDREMIAEQEKMIKEYYQKQQGKDKAIPAAPGTSPYELSKEVYTVEAGSSPWKGAKEAPVTLVVFTDFECVHCGTWAETLETMLKTFPGAIKVVFKNCIIPYHKNSESAAMAALAAGEQGKFWEMHDLLFKNQNALGKEALMGYAQALQLDMQKFESALASPELKHRIAQDVTQGKTLNIQNLPTTFVNGRSFMGSPPAEYIKGIIEETLKKGSQS